MEREANLAPASHLSSWDIRHVTEAIWNFQAQLKAPLSPMQMREQSQPTPSGAEEPFHQTTESWEIIIHTA